MDKGRPFQIEGPATAKARFCLVEVRANGTRRRPRSLNGGSESSVHFVWGRRTQQDRLEQGPANNAIPMQPSYILFAAWQGASAKCHAYISMCVCLSVCSLSSYRA